MKTSIQNIVCRIPGELLVTNFALIAKTAGSSDSQVTIECKGNIYSAKNMLELLTSGMTFGDDVVVSAYGDDAEETVRDIGRLLEEDVLDPMLPASLHPAFA